MMTADVTVAEASWITGLSVKAVNKAIEDAAVPVRVVRTNGARLRHIPYASLLCLRLHAEGLKRLPLRTRKEIFRQVFNAPRQKKLKCGEALIIDVAGVRGRMGAKLQDLNKTARMVHSDPEILTGTPVFRGTRVPVYLVADMVAQGTAIDEILDGYPSLTRDMVQYASIYAATHPRRGRPPLPPWSGTQPIARKMVKLRRVT